MPGGDRRAMRGMRWHVGSRGLRLFLVLGLLRHLLTTDGWSILSQPQQMDVQLFELLRGNTDELTTDFQAADHLS